jgi:formylglycine-generating enzyme required for sulfatase activity
MMLVLMRALIAASILLAAPQDELPALLKLFHEEFVPIPAGSFEMGGEGEKPVHAVKLATAFRMAKYEVTQNLWTAVMGDNPSRWKGRRNAVEMISYDDAVTFCAKATALMRASKLIDAAQIVRLPSEAEWEYAARAGTKTRYSFGDDVKDLDAHAWHTGNAAGNDPPVGAKKPNPWNLFDVHGYLWEWCADTWHGSYDEAPADGSAWTGGGDPKQRVLRGGSWKDPASRLTSSSRRGEPRELKDDAVGLRCVLAAGEKGKQ